MAEPITIYKLTILNMLDLVDYPLTGTQILNFFLEQDYTDYFKVQQVLNELTDAGLIIPESTHSNTVYTITESGRSTLLLLRSKLTDAIEHDTIAFLKKNGQTLRISNSLLADYRRTPDVAYAVRCQLLVRGRKRIDLTLIAASREQAEIICNNWKKQNEDVYAYLMDILMR